MNNQVDPVEMVPIRRTFAALRATTAEERGRLNLDAETSEYYTGSRYMVRKPFLMSDGTRHPQRYTNHHFTTKADAQEWIARQAK